MGTSLKSCRLMISKGWAPWKPLGWWKVRGGHPLKTCRLMKSEGWAPLWVDADSKKCQICVVQMTKKTLVHSFYHILYQPKGCPPLAAISLVHAVFSFFLTLLRLSWLFVFVGQQYIWNSVPAGFWYQLLQSFQSNGWIWFDTRSRSHRRYRWLSVYPILLCWLRHLLEKWINSVFF